MAAKLKLRNWLKEYGNKTNTRTKEMSSSVVYLKTC